MSELARAGWGLLLTADFPRLLAALSLALGMSPSQAMHMLTPREAAMLLDELGKEERARADSKILGDSPSEDASLLKKMLGN